MNFLKPAFFLGTCCLSAPAFADCAGPDLLSRLSAEQTQKLEAAVAATPYGEGVFWEATRGDERLLVIGTFHIGFEGLTPFVETGKAMMAGSDALLVESTLEDQQALQAELVQNPTLTSYSDAPYLDERIDDPDLWAEIAVTAESYGLTADAAKRLQPWLLALTFSISPCSFSGMASGVDHQLMFHAKDESLPVIALEDWRDQLELLNGGTFDEQVDALRMTLIGGELNSALFLSMRDSYLEEEIAQIWELSRLLSDFAMGDPELLRAQFEEMETDFLDARNLAWMPEIEAALEQYDRLTIAVGAAHLMGDTGLLNQLAERGWEITRLPLASGTE